MTPLSIFGSLTAGFLLYPGAQLTTAPAQRPAFQIEDARLLNPVVSAGELLDIRYRVNGDATQVCTNGGNAIYLGFIVQNLFPNSDALNRTSVAIGPQGSGEFRISDLRISRYAVPTQEYVIDTLMVYDCQGNRSMLFAAGGASTYYRDGQPTSIPLMTFHLNENPGGDNTPPVIRSIRTDKPSYGPGEVPRFQIESTDENSGVSTFAAAYLVLDSGRTLSGVDFHARKLEGNRLEATPFRIPSDLDGSSKEGTVTSFNIQDRAGNWGEIRLPRLNSEFYVDSKGAITGIRAVRFGVRSSD